MRQLEDKCREFQEALQCKICKAVSHLPDSFTCLLGVPMPGRAGLAMPAAATAAALPSLLGGVGV